MALFGGLCAAFVSRVYARVVFVIPLGEGLANALYAGGTGGGDPQRRFADFGVTLA